MKRTRLILAILTWAALFLPALAEEKIVPVPPDYILDKQLPGEDAYSILKPVFSPDSAYVAAMLGTPPALAVWEVKTGQKVAEIVQAAHGLDSIDGLEFSNDGKQLIVLRHFLPMKYIDWKQGKVVREIPLNADPKKILSYALSPNQDLVAVGTYTGIQLWDTRAGKKLKDYVPGKAISGLDMLIATDPKTRKVIRLLAYGRALVPPDNKFEKVAGLIDLDSGKVTPLLEDIPANKKVEGAMTFFYVSFEWGGGHLLVSYNLLPPKVKAGAYLIDTWTGKYLANQELGHLVTSFTTRYLWKPYYGFVINTYDITDPTGPYKNACQFLMPGRTELKILDTIDQNKLPVQAIRINQTNTLAAISLKKDAMDTAKLYLYKVVPKKPKP